ncbi:MAG: nuclease [Gemmatimonadales bacterium]
MASLFATTSGLTALHRRVKALAEQRPGIYRMLDASGRVLYIGKAKRVKARLLSYFQARPGDDKAGRILDSASDIAWEYHPSEFAAHLAELREIRKWRPPWNVQMNRHRGAVFVRVSATPAPRLTTVARPGDDGGRYYGPLSSPGRTLEAIRVLNDLLGLRDCAERMPMVFAEQGDLFAAPRQAGCAGYELDRCSGPCAGLVSIAGYAERLETAVAFLEGRALAPLDRVIAAMGEAADRSAYELAARWRERFEALEWLLAATTRARAAVELLTFVYRQPGSHGDDRAYLIQAGVVRAVYPWPTTPIEREAFRAVAQNALAGAIPTRSSSESIEEMLLVMRWFRRHPEALRRTTPIEQWM